MRGQRPAATDPDGPRIDLDLAGFSGIAEIGLRLGIRPPPSSRGRWRRSRVRWVGSRRPFSLATIRHRSAIFLSGVAPAAQRNVPTGARLQLHRGRLWKDQQSGAMSGTAWRGPNAG